MKLDPMQDRGQKGEKKNMDKEDCRLSCRQKRDGERGRKRKKRKTKKRVSF